MSDNSTLTDSLQRIMRKYAFMTADELHDIQCAIDMLRAGVPMEPVAPIMCSLEDYDGHVSKWHNCGACFLPIYEADKFCRHCGRAVEWDD